MRVLCHLFARFLKQLSTLFHDGFREGRVSTELDEIIVLHDLRVLLEQCHGIALSTDAHHARDFFLKKLLQRLYKVGHNRACNFLAMMLAACTPHGVGL